MQHYIDYIDHISRHFDPCIFMCPVAYLGHRDEVIWEEIGVGLICSYEIHIVTSTKSKPPRQLGTLSSSIVF